ncbi:MAG: AbrB/MazE/SpoVT family DNA-binding domain-containing protein [Candidatus Bathyarchaeia archaeon]
MDSEGFHGKYLNTIFYLMGCIARVTSKSMVTIPVKIMRKYGIKEGMKVKFIETEAGILMIPIPKLEDLHGVDRQHTAALIEGIRELEAEHRKEAEAD